MSWIARMIATKWGFGFRTISDRVDKMLRSARCGSLFTLRELAVLMLLICGSGSFVFAESPSDFDSGADEVLEDEGRMALLDDERALGVGDRLLYEVIEEREPPVIVYVNDRGNVRFPLIGEVDAGGLTCRELAYSVKKQLEESFFFRATVILRFPGSDNSRGQVYVAGGVRRQGSFPIPSDQLLTVTGAIMAAGGLDAGADPEQVTIVRRGPGDSGEETRITVNIREILETGSFEKDVAVHAEDVIVVPRRGAGVGTVFVVGAVNSPGIIEVAAGSDLTVSKAILQRGGFTRFARQRDVKLIRGDPSLPDTERTISVNVLEILEKGLRERDPEVHPGDLIRVEERLIAF